MFVPEFTELQAKDNDIFLLCSDGLSDFGSNDEIEQVLRDSSLEKMPDALVDSANDKGGYDSVAAVVVQLSDDNS